MVETERGGNQNQNQNQNGKKILHFTEQHVCSLLQRYPAAAILAVLGEVAQSPAVKLDWERLVKKTKSGIKTAAELQALWRHLAYGHPLIINNNSSEDDEESESDLEYEYEYEYEVEPYPPDSSSSSEAAACVRLLASGSPSSDFNIIHNHNSNINNNNTAAHPPPPPAAAAAAAAADYAEHEVNTIPPPPPADTGGLVDPNPNNNNNNNLKKKRKWTEEDDSKLLAAVHKWGEGNWSSVLTDLPFYRTPTQLSMRWSLLRKKHHAAAAAAATPAPQPQPQPLLSEAQLATRRAIHLALSHNSTPSITPANAAQPKVATPSTPTPTPTPKPPAAAPIKPRPPFKKPPPPNPVSLQRTAVAAGARVLSPSHPDALRNYSTVHFFRSATTPQPSHLPKPTSSHKTPTTTDTPLKANPPIQGTDEAFKQVLANPVLVDVADKGSRCPPHLDGKPESFSGSVADGTTEKVDGPN